MSSPMLNRKYQQILGRNIVVAIMLIMIIGLITEVVISAPIFLIIILTIGILALTPNLIKIIRRGVLQEYEERLVCYPSMGPSYFLKWEDILSFETKGNAEKHRQVYAKVKNSEKLKTLQGVGTKRLFQWNGGQTTNMAKELNSRLELYRASQS
jgi:hypothetical protein